MDENGACAIPRTESMKDVSRRVVGYWEKEIVPVVKSGKRVLVTVRTCLIMHWFWEGHFAEVVIRGMFRHT